MSKLGGLLGRKANSIHDRAVSPQLPETPGLELDQELFSPFASQLGEENELLRGLLAEADYRVCELDMAKETMAKLIEPVSKTLRALEIANSEKLSLQTVLNSTRLAYSKLRNDYAATEKKAEALDAEFKRLQEDFDIVQQYVGTLEAAKAEQLVESAARRNEDSELQRRMQQDSAELQALREENRRYQERFASSDKKLLLAENEMETARHKLTLSDKERLALQASLDESLVENARMSRKLVEMENVLGASQTRLRQMETTLNEGEEERSRLALALEEAKEGYASELNTQRARIEALQARSSTTDKLLDDSRYNLSARAEEIRAFERRFAEATAMRAGVEGKLAQIETGLCERDRQIRDLEQARAVLIERNEALAKSVAGRENAYNRAQERIQGLDERIRELEVELQSTREVHEAEDRGPENSNQARTARPHHRRRRARGRTQGRCPAAARIIDDANASGCTGGLGRVRAEPGPPAAAGSPAHRRLTGGASGRRCRSQHLPKTARRRLPSVMAVGLQAGADVDFGCERAVHGTLVGDLQQAVPIRLAELSRQGDRPIDAIDHALLALAGLAIFGVFLRMREMHRDAIERQRFAVGIKAQCHRRAGTEPGEQQVIG